MNIFKKCSICGENFKVTIQGGELELEGHLRDAHPEEHQERLRLETKYFSKLNELHKLYPKRNVSAWFADSTKKEWEKSQPIKPKPMDELLTLMKNGWEVGVYSGWGSGEITAQKNGLGKGGESRHYSRNVVNALIKRNLIRYVEVKSFPLVGKYVLVMEKHGERTE